MKTKEFDPHRCAVCWNEQTTHKQWFDHCSQTHGATLNLFGYGACVHNCPGKEHATRLPNYGMPRRPKPAAAPQPIIGKDGNTYTPLPLPLE